MANILAIVKAGIDARSSPTRVSKHIGIMNSRRNNSNIFLTDMNYQDKRWLGRSARELFCLKYTPDGSCFVAKEAFADFAEQQAAGPPKEMMLNRAGLNKIILHTKLEALLNNHLFINSNPF